MKIEKNWSVEIRPDSGWFYFNFKEIWDYRDLLLLFVRRDIVTVYKQTILGPLWYIIQPLLTTAMFTLIFSRIAKISTEGIPAIVFYLSGITIWGYFSDCLTRTSNTFVTNQHIFGKVYFPRIIVPGSIVISSLVKFLIQLAIFIFVCFYFYMKGEVLPNFSILLLPLVILIMAIMSLGFGMLFSSMTTKYRDLQFLLGFAIQLWMYATPIIYPLSSIPKGYSDIIRLNPLTPLVESVRYGFLGTGDLSMSGLVYSSVFSIVIFCLGFMVFSKVEKNFMDSV